MLTTLLYYHNVITLLHYDNIIHWRYFIVEYLLAIDQGTSSTRAILQNLCGKIEYLKQKEFKCHYPGIQWVEQNPQIILSTTIECLKDCLNEAQRKGGKVKAIGITNQRETTILWDKNTGKPIYDAIVWQDRRTANYCSQLINSGYEKEIKIRTGLVIDPYFSATKIKWILDNTNGARLMAKKGALAFGTIDTFLLWHLTGGKVHATDATNASRTMLFNLEKQEWDKELLKIFDIPYNILPEVKDSVCNYGFTDKKIVNETIPITAILGDQQASAFGQACFTPGILKCTYGTGCFAIMNIGDVPVYSSNRLLTTVAYRINNKPTFALEGSVFMAGAAVDWLKNNLLIINNPSDTEELAKSLLDNEGVYLVPAFTGLGAPHWILDAKGILVGLTRDTNKAHIARAVLEAACYQTFDLYKAMSNDCGHPLHELRVDGGMTNNKWMLQFLSNISNMRILKTNTTQVTAYGAAIAAGMGAKIYTEFNDIKKLWSIEKEYIPEMDAALREKYLSGWNKAIKTIKECK